MRQSDAQPKSDYAIDTNNFDSVLMEIFYSDDKTLGQTSRKSRSLSRTSSPRSTTAPYLKRLSRDKTTSAISSTNSQKQKILGLSSKVNYRSRDIRSYFQIVQNENIDSVHTPMDITKPTIDNTEIKSVPNESIILTSVAAKISKDILLTEELKSDSKKSSSPMEISYTYNVEATTTHNTSEISMKSPQDANKSKKPHELPVDKMFPSIEDDRITKKATNKVLMSKRKIVKEKKVKAISTEHSAMIRRKILKATPRTLRRSVSLTDISSKDYLSTPVSKKSMIRVAVTEPRNKRKLHLKDLFDSSSEDEGKFKCKKSKEMSSTAYSQPSKGLPHLRSGNQVGLRCYGDVDLGVTPITCENDDVLPSKVPLLNISNSDVILCDSCGIRCKKNRYRCSHCWYAKITDHEFLYCDHCECIHTKKKHTSSFRRHATCLY